MGNEIIIKFEWLKLEDYQFKILMLVKMLSTNEEQTTYSGTLQDMRKWLNLGQSPKNNKCIDNAIKELKKNNIIDYATKGRIYNISIIDEIKENELLSSKKIAKADVNTIRKYVIDNHKRILGNMLKIFIFAQDNETVITYANLGLLLNIITEEDVNENGKYKTNKISNAINSLRECKFESTTYFESKLKWLVDTTEQGQQIFLPKGSLIRVNNKFN